MRTVFLVASLLAFGLARAAELPVADLSERDLNFSNHITLGFGFNADLGRAWVTVSTHPTDSETPGEHHRFLVKGLTYDQSRETIQLDVDGQVVDCASVIVRGRSIFKQKVLEQTRSCKLVGSHVTKVYDNGFERFKATRYTVKLVTE